MPDKPYTDLKIDDFSGGLMTKWEETSIPNNASPDLQNVVFSGKGAIEPRTGNEIFGASTSSTGPIQSTYTFRKRNGDEVPMRSYVSAMEYYNTETSSWEILDQGYTPSLKFDFANYSSGSYGEDVFFCNGTDVVWRWTGALGKLSVDVDALSTVFYLSTSHSLSALGWLTSGSGVVDGEEFVYASLSGNALSSITRAGGSVNHFIGAGVAQLPLSSGFTGVPRGNILEMLNARLFIGGISGNQGALYYSKVDNPLDFSYSSPRVASDGGIVNFAEYGGPVNAMKPNEGKIVALKENSIHTLDFQTSADLPVMKGIIAAPFVGAVNNKGTCGVENEIFFASPLGTIRSLGRLPQVVDVVQVQDVSDQIINTVNNYNWLSAASIYYNKKLYIACATSGAAANNTVFVYDYAYKAWTKYNDWNVSDWFIYENNLYYGDSLELRTYKTGVNYDDNNFLYESYWTSKVMDFDIPNELKRCRWIYVEGYLTKNGSLTVDVMYNGESSATVSKTISGTGSYVSTSEMQTWIGGNTWGEGVYGGGTGYTTYNLYKFRVKLSLANIDFYNLQVKVSQNTQGTPFKLEVISPYVEKQDGRKFPPTSII